MLFVWEKFSLQYHFHTLFVLLFQQKDQEKQSARRDIFLILLVRRKFPYALHSDGSANSNVLCNSTRPKCPDMSRCQPWAMSAAQLPLSLLGESKVWSAIDRGLHLLSISTSFYHHQEVGALCQLEFADSVCAMFDSQWESALQKQ